MRPLVHVRIELGLEVATLFLLRPAKEARAAHVIITKRMFSSFSGEVFDRFHALAVVQGYTCYFSSFNVECIGTT